MEHRSDEEDPVVRRPGDLYFEYQTVVHWLENVSDSPARVISVDIFSPEVQ